MISTLQSDKHKPLAAENHDGLVKEKDVDLLISPCLPFNSNVLTYSPCNAYQKCPFFSSKKIRTLSRADNSAEKVAFRLWTDGEKTEHSEFWMTSVENSIYVYRHMENWIQ